MGYEQGNYQSTPARPLQRPAASQNGYQMNIFATHKSPIISARALDDKRLVKMITEGSQMMSTALRFHGADDLRLWRSAWLHHPIVHWVCASRGNFLWLLVHTEAMYQEYQFRFGKRIHKSALLLPTFTEHIGMIPDGPLQKFQNSAANAGLGIDFHHISDTCQAYRLYLNARWSNSKVPPRWTKRKPPTWIQKEN